MLFSITAIVTLLAAAAAASPTKSGWRGNDWKKHWADKWNKNDYKNHNKGDSIFHFDKIIVVKADPGQVRNGTTAVPGQPGAKGLYQFGINVADNTICYNITMSGVTGDYLSPALTATHLHEAARGASGPPRLAFPDPQGPDDRRVSYGCLTGPFKTGLPVNGTDNGTNFHVKQLIDNPAGFFADSHTSQYSLGAVRGQLA